MIDKIPTMKVPGGQTEAAYNGDGRLFMARSLERVWPGVVETKRRYKRPQHVVAQSWQRFDTPLKLKAGIDLSSLPRVDEFGMSLHQVKENVKSPAMRKMLRDYSAPKKGKGK
jgi:ABC-type Fe2+-enterobactin transport system substrate-binding protein